MIYLNNVTSLCYISLFLFSFKLGVLLLYVAISQGYDLVLILLYAHIVLMYTGACISHTTLIGSLFSCTVSGVIANSLQAFFWWGYLLGGPFDHYGGLLSWCGLVAGLIVGVGGVFYIQSLDCFAPIGGFITLSIVQPPFVFLGLVSATYLHSLYPKDPGYKLLFIGGSFLMIAMGLSAIEAFVDPILLGSVTTKLIRSEFEHDTDTTIQHVKVGLAGFPLLHVIIHIMEQVGIYLYGTGSAWVHLKYVVKRQGLQLTKDFFFFVKINETDSESSINSDQKCYLDLLNHADRMCPGKMNMRIVEETPSGICPAIGETCVYAMCDPSEIRSILKNPHNFSSNPYPDERLIGLSTTAGSRHDIQRKIAGKFFSRSALQEVESRRHSFSKIAEWVTDSFIAQGGGDIVHGWGYRIAVASGLVALGVPVDDLLFSSESIPFASSRGIQFVDQMSRWSRHAVNLVAPIGGTGPRYGVTLTELFSFIYHIILSIPGTFQLLFSIGLVEAWKIFRPDVMLTGQLFPYFSTECPCPRSGLFLYPASIPEMPAYFNTVRDMWVYYAELHPDTFFGALMVAKNEQKITEAEALLLIVQCLVSMTTANAMINAVVNLHNPGAHSLTCGDLNKKNWGKTLLSTPSDLKVEKYIDECLFYIPPLQRLPRRVTCKSGADISGQRVKYGDHLIMMLGAANNQQGSAKNPSSSLTFGAGIHRCLGEDLVRIEMKVALSTWIRAIKQLNMQVKSGEISRIADVDVGNYGFEKYDVYFY